jgi:uncharacterized protein (TIGR03435 family)
MRVHFEGDRLMRTTLATALMLCAFSEVIAQSPSLQPDVEVASVKLHQGPVPIAGGEISTSGPRLTVQAYSMLGLLMYAYNLKRYQVPGAASLDHSMYDILAIADDYRTPTRDDFRRLMQSILAARFKLRTHRATKEMAVLALVVDKGGPKFSESAPDTSSTPQYRTSGRNIEANIPATTMEGLAERIRNNAGLDRPVLDETGLTRTYAIKLMYTHERRMPGAAESDPSAISIFTAVREQLGLRLEPRKALCEVLIVDHVEKPSEN